MSSRLLKITLSSALIAFFCWDTEVARGQQVRTGGTTTAAGGGAAASPAAGGTTSGLTGLTTSGLATDGAAEGGFAGANAAQAFVGGNATDGGFVGGARQSTGVGAANRQFRGITDEGVVGGQTGQQTGTPRRIPVAFRVSFQVPPISQMQTGTLAAANDVSIQRFTTLRPELSGINADLDTAGVVTLSGTVPNDAASRLAANLMRLQPGVRSVSNQLSVE